MNPVTEYFSQSELAWAAYGNFNSGRNLVAELQDEKVGMSAIQAASVGWAKRSVPTNERALK